MTQLRKFVSGERQKTDVRAVRRHRVWIAFGLNRHRGFRSLDLPVLRAARSGLLVWAARGSAELRGRKGTDFPCIQHVAAHLRMEGNHHDVRSWAPVGCRYGASGRIESSIRIDVCAPECTQPIRD